MAGPTAGVYRLLLIAIGLVACLDVCEAYPTPNTRRWAGNQIIYNIDPLSFPSGSDSLNAVVNGYASWDLLNIPGSGFMTSSYTQPVPADPVSGNDQINTIGFATLAANTMAATLNRPDPSDGSKFAETDILINRLFRWDTFGNTATPYLTCSPL